MLRHHRDLGGLGLYMSYLALILLAAGLGGLGGCALVKASAPTPKAEEETPPAPVTRSMTVWMDLVDEEPSATGTIIFNQYFVPWPADINRNYTVDLLDVNELIIQMGRKGAEHVYIGADFFLSDRCSPITDVLLVAYEKDPNLPPVFARTDMSGRATFMDPWPWPWMVDRVELADDE